MVSFVRAILYILLRILTRLTILGAENLPQEGGCIIATNHLSVVDAPLIFCVIKRKDFTALVARKHKTNPLFFFLVNLVNGIWIDRYLLEVEPLRQMINHLKKGGMLGLSPEGTRSQSRQLIKAKEGVAYLAARANVPIVPIGISGSENVLPDAFLFKRPRVCVRFGELFHLPPLDPQDRNGSLLRNTDEIMCRIAALLPEWYRGVYTNHPRLKELLAIQEMKSTAA